MSNAVIAPGVRKNVFVKSASTAATGPVLTYTVPANLSATITSYRAIGIAATVQVVLHFIFRGVSTINEQTPAAGTGVSALVTSYNLMAGDVIEFSVSTATAATTADFYISFFEEAA